MPMVKTKDLRGQFRDLDKKDVHKLLILQARFQLLIRIIECFIGNTLFFNLIKKVNVFPSLAIILFSP
jgi:hypothetical protein